MLSGNFNSSEESKRISGTDCAATGMASSIAASEFCNRRLMWMILFLFVVLRFQQEFLDAPGLDLRNVDLVGIAAIHHVHHLEPRRFLAGMAEFAEDGPVQFHLVDFSANVPRPRGVTVGIGVGRE